MSVPTSFSVFRKLVEESNWLVNCGPVDKQITFDFPSDTYKGLAVIVDGPASDHKRDELHFTLTPIQVQSNLVALGNIQRYFDAQYPVALWDREGWNACLKRDKKDGKWTVNVRVKLARVDME